MDSFTGFPAHNMGRLGYELTDKVEVCYLSDEGERKAMFNICRSMAIHL
jgi:hypothetical protein